MDQNILNERYFLNLSDVPEFLKELVPNVLRIKQCFNCSKVCDIPYEKKCGHIFCTACLIAKPLRHRRIVMVRCSVCDQINVHEANKCLCLVNLLFKQLFEELPLGDYKSLVKDFANCVDLEISLEEICGKPSDKLISLKEALSNCKADTSNSNTETLDVVPIAQEEGIVNGVRDYLKEEIYTIIFGDNNQKELPSEYETCDKNNTVGIPDIYSSDIGKNTTGNVYKIVSDEATLQEVNIKTLTTMKRSGNVIQIKKRNASIQLKVHVIPHEKSIAYSDDPEKFLVFNEKINAFEAVHVNNKKNVKGDNAETEHDVSVENVRKQNSSELISDNVNTPKISNTYEHFNGSIENQLVKEDKKCTDVIKNCKTNNFENSDSNIPNLELLLEIYDNIPNETILNNNNFDDIPMLDDYCPAESLTSTLDPILTGNIQRYVATNGEPYLQFDDTAYKDVEDLAGYKIDKLTI